MFIKSEIFIYSTVLLRNMVNNEITIIGRISRGSKMDQIYLPKRRIGFIPGEYVIISPLVNPLGEKELSIKLNFYGLKKLEPVKVNLIEEIVKRIRNKVNVDNIIFTGSFLEKGFRFNDIDILLISESEKSIEISLIKKEIEEFSGIKPHLICLSNKTLSSGLSNDPLYNLMLSKCVSLNKIIFNVKRKINYKLLDLNLLKSKNLIENFNMLNGDEKYYLTLNMVSILMFIQNKKLSKEIVEKEIEKLFDIKINDLKGNMIEESFILKYKEIFNKTFSLVLDNIKGEERK